MFSPFECSNSFQGKHHGTCHQAAKDTSALGNGTCKEQWGSWETGVTHPKGKGQLRGTGGGTGGAMTAMLPSWRN